MSECRMTAVGSGISRENDKADTEKSCEMRSSLALLWGSSSVHLSAIFLFLQLSERNPYRPCI
jgi:hypothetical protein